MKRLIIQTAVIRLVVVQVFFMTFTVQAFAGENRATHYQTTHNVTLVKKAFDNWAKGTGGLFDLLDENMTWIITGNDPLSGIYTSKKELMEKIIIPFGQKIAQSLKPAVRNIYGDGSTVIALFDAQTTANDNKPYKNTYAWFLEMENDKIHKVTAVLDLAEFRNLWDRVASAK